MDVVVLLLLLVSLLLLISSLLLLLSLLHLHSKEVMKCFEFCCCLYAIFTDVLFGGVNKCCPLSIFSVKFNFDVTGVV